MLKVSTWGSFALQSWAKTGRSVAEVWMWRELIRTEFRHTGADANVCLSSTHLNIRLSSRDLEAIQKRALVEGLPYQTLIASLLHKYASGRLREIVETAIRAAPSLNGKLTRPKAMPRPTLMCGHT